MLASEVSPERRQEIIGRVAEKVVDLKLSPVAIVMLESSKPISFVGSQLMVFLQPIVTAVFPLRMYDEVAALLEDRDNVEALIQTIERLEDERRHAKGKDKPDSCH
jgi:hypothetical protein